jgi:hypothetical protein
LNNYQWVSALLNTRLPEQVMRLFGKKKRNNGFLTFTIVSVVLSALTAVLFRNNRMMKPLRNMAQKTDFPRSFMPNMNAIAEFASELGLTNKAMKKAKHSAMKMDEHQKSGNPVASSHVHANEEQNQASFEHLATAMQATGDLNNDQIKHLTDQIVNNNK